jgi:hypothetical protein
MKIRIRRVSATISTARKGKNYADVRLDFPDASAIEIRGGRIEFLVPPPRKRPARKKPR